MSMGINGIYGNFLQNYSTPAIPAVNVDNVKEQERSRQKAQESPVVPAYEEAFAERVRKPDAALEDLSVTFNKQDDFGYIGKDSDIRSLDVEKAISDMQKDKMLQQYQYFVGSSRNLTEQGSPAADGIVVPKF